MNLEIGLAKSKRKSTAGGRFGCEIVQSLNVRRSRHIPIGNQGEPLTIVRFIRSK